MLLASAVYVSISTENAACSNKTLHCRNFHLIRVLQRLTWIYFVTYIKQTCLWHGLGVTITARKRPSKLMFTIKDLGHTLPGHLLVRQNQTFANSRLLKTGIYLLGKFAYFQRCGLSREK